MAKKGMKRSDRTHTQPRNQLDPVPELQGKARPVVSGTGGSKQKVRHTDKPIPAGAYPAIDADLARDNLENDIPADDLPEL